MVRTSRCRRRGSRISRASVSAEFVTSVGAGGQVSTAGLPVVALVGRSNVGKSSLINALVKKKIARAGAKPGTTSLLNVYRVSEPPSGLRPFVLVDLPGYGYARGGAEARKHFDALTRDFFDQVGPEGPAGHDGRLTLAAVILVLDIRHPGLELDLAALAWATERRYPRLAVATKADRVARSARLRAHKAHLEALGDPSLKLVVVSTRTGDGIRQVWSELKEFLGLR